MCFQISHRVNVCCCYAALLFFSVSPFKGFLCSLQFYFYRWQQMSSLITGTYMCHPMLSSSDDIKRRVELHSHGWETHIHTKTHTCKSQWNYESSKIKPHFHWAEGKRLHTDYTTITGQNYGQDGKHFYSSRLQLVTLLLQESHSTAVSLPRLRPWYISGFSGKLSYDPA